MSTKVKLVDSYDDEVHRIGRISGVTALIVIIAIPTLICLRFNIFPPINSLLMGILTVAMMYIPICIIEVLIYTPMIGSGASYLAFVSGNLTNLKIPCVAMAMDIAEVKPSSKEADIISTISVAVSTLVTEVIIIIGVLAIVPLAPILNSPVLAPAFSNILPALFGGLGAYWILKEWKLAIAPLFAAIVLAMFLTLPTAVLVPVGGLISIGAARLMYKRGWLDEKKA